MLYFISKLRKILPWNVAKRVAEDDIKSSELLNERRQIRKRSEKLRARSEEIYKDTLAYKASIAFGRQNGIS